MLSFNKKHKIGFTAEKISFLSGLCGYSQRGHLINIGVCKMRD